LQLADNLTLAISSTVCAIAQLRVLAARAEGWLILERGPLQIEFFPRPAIDPKTTIASCCLRVDDVDALHAAFAAAGVPTSNRGMPRLTAPVTQPWGLREAALVTWTATCFGCCRRPEVRSRLSAARASDKMRMGKAGRRSKAFRSIGVAGVSLRSRR
jgi:hypothetical protein